MEPQRNNNPGNGVGGYCPGHIKKCPSKEGGACKHLATKRKSEAEITSFPFRRPCRQQRQREQKGLGLQQESR